MGRHRRQAPHGRGGKRKAAALVVAALVGLGTIATVVAVTGDRPCTTNCPPPASAAQPSHSATPSAPPPAAMQLGVAHVQNSVRSDGNSAAVASAQKVLSRAVVWQVHALMGWGNPNPEPSPGVYDWTGLDRRMELTRATHGRPILVLCCAPDWMKGGTAGTTKWDQLETAVDPEHYADFADLAVAAARRYPQVHSFVVWNEMKGFWSSELGRWDHEAYTEMYNTVYDALKAYDPTLKVGGPYVHLNAYRSPDSTRRSSLQGCWGVIDQRDLDAITYWLEHAHGADFVAVDGGTETRGGRLTCAPMAANEKFAVVTTWLRSRTYLPVWWMELYPQIQPEDAPASDPRRAAVFADALRRLHRAGAAAVFLWSPEASTKSMAALWTSTADPGGGKPLPLATMFPTLRKEFGSR